MGGVCAELQGNFRVEPGLSHRINPKSTRILLINGLPPAAAVRRWPSAMTQIGKRTAEGAKQSDRHHWDRKMTYLGEAFEEEAASSCARIRLRRLCLGLVSRRLRPVGAMRDGATGAGSCPSGSSVESNTDAAACWRQSAVDTIMEAH